MAATAAPVALTGAWTSIGAAGYSYLVDAHDDDVRIAFASSTPGATVLGHAIQSGDVITPPTGMAVYARAESGSARATVTQGDALS
jgi:hypothetical protein